MGRHGWDSPDSTSANLTLLVTDPEVDRSSKHHPELLVGVAVLRQDRSGLTFHDGKGQALTVHRACQPAVSKHLWRDRVELFEGAHGYAVTVKIA